MIKCQSSHLWIFLKQPRSADITGSIWPLKDLSSHHQYARPRRRRPYFARQSARWAFRGFVFCSEGWALNDHLREHSILTHTKTQPNNKRSMSVKHLSTILYVKSKPVLLFIYTIEKKYIREKGLKIFLTST